MTIAFTQLRKHRVRFFALAVQLVILPQVCVVATAQVATGGHTAGSSDATSALDGRALYLKHYCGLCHTFEKAGTAGIFGPSHNRMKELAAIRLEDSNYKGSAKTADQYIRESILEPTAYIVPGYETSVQRMPAYKNLSAEEVEALVKFLLGDSS